MGALRVVHRGREVLRLPEAALEATPGTLHWLTGELAARTALAPVTMKLLHQGKRLTDPALDLRRLVTNTAGEASLVLVGSQAAEVAAVREVEARAAPGQARLRNDLEGEETREQRRARIAALGGTLVEDGEAAPKLRSERGFGFGRLVPLAGLPMEDRARRTLEGLASDPGVLAVMDKFGWNVGELCEMYPEGKVGISDVCVMGLNENHGQRIRLRLRTDDLQGFRKLLSIRNVLFHELAHNVHSEHDSDFFQLMRRIEEEAAALDWRRAEGHTSGDGRRVRISDRDVLGLNHATGAAVKGAADFNPMWIRDLSGAAPRGTPASFQGGSGTLGGEADDALHHADPRNRARLAAAERRRTQAVAQRTPMACPGAFGQRCACGLFHAECEPSSGACEDAGMDEDAMDLVGADRSIAPADAPTPTPSSPSPDLEAAAATPDAMPKEGAEGDVASMQGDHGAVECKGGRNEPVACATGDDATMQADATRDLRVVEARREEEPVDLHAGAPIQKTETAPDTSEADAAFLAAALHEMGPAGERLRDAVEALIRGAGAWEASRRLAAASMVLIILRNVVENPTEEKYQSIRETSRAFQSRIAGVSGAVDVLEAVGFAWETGAVPEGRRLVWKRKDLALLWAGKALLEAGVRRDA